MKPNQFIQRKRLECARRGHGKIIRGQCQLCGQAISSNERHLLQMRQKRKQLGLLDEGGEKLTETEEEAMQQIKRSKA